MQVADPHNILYALSMIKHPSQPTLIELSGPDFHLFSPSTRLRWSASSAFTPLLSNCTSEKIRLFVRFRKGWKEKGLFWMMLWRWLVSYAQTREVVAMLDITLLQTVALFFPDTFVPGRFDLFVFELQILKIELVTGGLVLICYKRTRTVFVCSCERDMLRKKIQLNG